MGITRAKKFPWPRDTYAPSLNYCTEKPSSESSRRVDKSIILCTHFSHLKITRYPGTHSSKTDSTVILHFPRPSREPRRRDAPRRRSNNAEKALSGRHAERHEIKPCRPVIQFNMARGFPLLCLLCHAARAHLPKISPSLSHSLRSRPTSRPDRSALILFINYGMSNDAPRPYPRSPSPSNA